MASSAIKSIGQRGFVLVSVLWILVIMVMAASAFSVWVDRVRENASQRQQQVEAYRASRDVLTKVTFTYLTGIKSARGMTWPASTGQVKPKAKYNSLDDFMSGAAPIVTASLSGFLQMDGSVIDGGNGLRFMMQDQAGFIGVSALSQAEFFNRLSSAMGGGKTAGQLRDTLRDYQDADDIRSMQGAEQHEYRSRGMAVPMNGYLRTPLQLRAIMDWQDILKNHDDAWILRVFRIEGGSVVNVNTASAEALSLVIQDQSKIADLITNRTRAAFTKVSDLQKYSAKSEDIPFAILPAGGFRFWWWYEGSSTANIYDVQFASLEPGADAWYINWTARVTLPDDLAKSTPSAIDHPFFR